MAKIIRYDGDVKPFGVNATGTERTVFGSPSATPVQSDTLDANINADYLLGWEKIAPGAKPPKQYFNGALFTATQLNAYLHQMGIAEWNDKQEYQINSFTNRNGVLYRCKTADHISITPPEEDTVNWVGLEGIIPKNLFKKSDSSIPAFSKTGVFTVSTNQEFYAEVNDIVLTIPASTVVSMPAATVGTDYAIWLNPDITLQATNNFTTPPVVGARKIGGFHYAPGGNAPAQAGGDSTPQINEYSFYDLNYRPVKSDPRGLTCVAGSFWAAIYLLNTAPDANGISSYGKTIADGSSPPIIPSALGGNGSLTYGSLTWFESGSIATAMGMRMLTQPEFMTAAYGVTEATARGTDPVTTGLDAARTSRWGLMQATGNLWTWSQDRGGPFSSAAWVANTEGFGSEYNAPNASLLGASWADGVIAGSRSSGWDNSAATSSSGFGLRLVCDHLQLD